jgi:hypothetical protein
MAQIYQKLGKYEASEQYNARALAIRENNVASSSSDVGEALNHLASLNYSKVVY